MTIKPRSPKPSMSLPDWAGWDEAGIAVRAGQLDRSSSARLYRVPFKVELAGDTLEYWWGSPHETGKIVR